MAPCCCGLALRSGEWACWVRLLANSCRGCAKSVGATLPVAIGCQLRSGTCSASIPALSCPGFLQPRLAGAVFQQDDPHRWVASNTALQPCAHPARHERHGCHRLAPRARFIAAAPTLFLCPDNSCWCSCPWTRSSLPPLPVRPEYSLLLATFGAIMQFGLEGGIAAGIVLATLYFAFAYAKSQVSG